MYSFKILMSIQQNRQRQLVAPQVKRLFVVFQFLNMTNIFRVKNIISRGHSQSLPQQHQFLNKVISHIEYLFGSLIISPPNNQLLHAQQMALQPQLINKEDDQVKQNIQSNKQSEESINNAEQVPSIEQISNFEELEQFQEKARSNKKRIRKMKLAKKKRSKLYQNTKKPVSSFVYFYKDRLKQIKSSHGSKQLIHIGNLAKMLSAQWRILSQSEKKPYIQMAQRSLQQYYSDKQKIIDEKYPQQVQEGKDNSFINQETLNQVKEGSIEQENEPSNHPALSSFLIYFNAHSQRISKQTGLIKRSKLAKILSQEWKHLSPIQRKKYQSNPKKQDQNISNNKESKVTVDNHSKKLKKPQTKDEEEYLPMFKVKNKKINKKLHLQQNQIPVEKENKELNHNQAQLINHFKNKENGMQNNQEPYIQEESHKEKTEKGDQLNKYTIIELNSNDQEEDQSLSNEAQSKILSRRKKQKKIRGPISAFLLYYQQNIKQLMLQNIKGQGSDLVKLASAHWAKLPQEQRQIYIQEAKISREVYHREMEQFRNQKKASSKKPQRDKNDQK